MLPESPEARRFYFELRDTRNRLRQAQLTALHGDLDAFNAYLIAMLWDESEVPMFREVADFCLQEGVLTPEIKECVDNLVSWGDALRARLGAKP
jgi:hypothetical protein